MFGGLFGPVKWSSSGARSSPLCSTRCHGLARGWLVPLGSRSSCIETVNVLRLHRPSALRTNGGVMSCDESRDELRCGRGWADPVAAVAAVADATGRALDKNLNPCGPESQSGDQRGELFSACHVIHKSIHFRSLSQGKRLYFTQPPRHGSARSNMSQLRD